MEKRRSIFKTSGALSARSMLTSVALHIPLVALLLLLPSQLIHSEPDRKELDIVFYRPPEIKVTARAVPVSVPRSTIATGAPAGAPAPALTPKPNAPPGPDAPGKPETLPPGPDEGYKAEPQPPKPKVGNTGILAFKEKIASLAQDKVVPLLGADARRTAANDIGRPSSPSTLTSNAPGSSGGINVA